MKARVLDEPPLEFRAANRHIDPRFGICLFGPADADMDTAPNRITVGVVGTARAADGLRETDGDREDVGNTFHDILKAKALGLPCPIQFIREETTRLGLQAYPPLVRSSVLWNSRHVGGPVATRSDLNRFASFVRDSQVGTKFPGATACGSRATPPSA